MTISEDRVKATIILHALGDTLGFRNGKWEFFGNQEFHRQKTLDFKVANEILYEFIAIGGINGINLKGWYVSDDTLLHKDVLESVVESNNKSKDTSSDTSTDISKDVLISLIKEKFIKTKHKYFDNRVNVNRYPGITTVRYIDKLKNNEDITKYIRTGGGNGAAMRAPVLGLAYHNDLNALIKMSIDIGKLTHTSPIGYLGSLNAAYFVYLAINGIHIHEWPYKLVELLESNNIKKLFDDESKEVQQDYIKYIDMWKKYIELRFDNDGVPQSRRSFISLEYRIQFYFDNFVEKEFGFIPGESGFLVNIMAYDALVDAENKWEKLVVYGMLHIGDSDTVGCIAASWYGALYGFGDVPASNLKYIEFSDELNTLAKELYTIIK